MKNDNQIAPHIRKTIDEIDADILALQQDVSRLTQTRLSLVNFYGGESEIPDVPFAPVHPGATVKVSSSKLKPSAPQANGQGHQGKLPSAETLMAVAKLRELPMPVTDAALAIATGLDLKRASNILFNLKVKGWLVCASRGEYTRTPEFPPKPI